MNFNRQFNNRIPSYMHTPDSRRHPLFDPQGCMSIGKMIHHISNGIPLSVPQPVADRLPSNNKKFFQDSFDVFDEILSSKREYDKKQAIAREEKRKSDEILKKEFEEFLNSKKSSAKSEDGTITT